MELRTKKQKIDAGKLLFSNHDLKVLLIPLMVEQLLNSLMGTVDSMMVSNVGSAAISAVSLVDSINVLVIQVFTALTAGGAIICSQYLGRKDVKACNKAARQVLLSMLVISIGLMAVCIAFRHPLLRLIFGNVEQDVMDNSQIYFLITALSFPFIGLFDANAAFFRAEGNSRLPMTISALCNLVNIAGNAILIYGAGIGAAGAALSTLFSRILSAVMIIVLLGKSDKIIVSNHWRVDTKILGKILYIGVPNGLENSIFQIGKLLTTSLIAGFGMAATTANAVTGSIASFQQIPANAIGVAMITVIGQCIGAGETEQALYYLKKMMKAAYACMVLLGIPMIIFARPICGIYHLSPETMKITVFLLCYSCVCCMLVHPLSFAQSNALRAAGDVRFTMIVAIASMWLCRVGMAYILGQGLGLGVIGVWIAMTMDWVVRAFLFTNRVRTGKWLKYKDRLVK